MTVQILLQVDNNGPTIEACFDSIFKQTHQDIAITILDNCSDDGSSEVIERLESAIAERTDHNYVYIRLHDPIIPEDCWTFLNDYYATQEQRPVVHVMTAADILEPNLLKDKYDNRVR